MSSSGDNNSLRGNILMISVLVISLLVFLALIILSYLEIISGTAEYVAVFGVVASFIYIIGDSVWMFLQDTQDGKNLADGEFIK